jgi:hypothetical protein
MLNAVEPWLPDHPIDAREVSLGKCDKDEGVFNR